MRLVAACVLVGLTAAFAMVVQVPDAEAAMSRSVVQEATSEAIEPVALAGVSATARQKPQSAVDRRTPVPANRTASRTRPQRNALLVVASAGAPDPVESGESVLEVRFLDRASGKAPRGRVDLWRIAAPGNDVWLGGDQRQQSRQLRSGFVSFKDLAAGTYRVFFRGNRRDAPDLPSIDVGEGVTRVEFTVEAARAFPWSLDLRDGSGKPVEKGQVSVRRLGGERAERFLPGWVSPRAPVKPTTRYSSPSRDGKSRTFEVTAGLGGVIDIGPVSEPTRVSVGRWRIEVTTPAGKVTAVLDGREASKQFATLVVPATSDLEGRVIDELGTRINDLDGRVQFSGGLVYGRRASAWRDARHDVTIRCPGFASKTVPSFQEGERLIVLRAD